MQAAWQTLAGLFVVDLMCTIAFLIDVIADAPLVLAANRDELYARPTRSPERLAPGIVGGVDELSGGTWLAVSARGRFAAVTNQRALATPPPGLRSRGLAVRELAAAADPDGYVDALDPTHYASMNLAWGDASGVSIAYLRQGGDKERVRLGRGVHVLCNDRLGAAGFPRGERLVAALQAALHETPAWSNVVPRITAALADHTRLPLADVPTSELAPELARELTATCIHSPAYGTRSSTVFAAAAGRAVGYLHADGPPCTTPFADLRDLLEAA